MTETGSQAGGELLTELYHPQKGDVCYVPWRKQYWPSLIKNSYPKKITYAFFPLPENEKATTFTLAQPKKSMKLALTDIAPDNSTSDYIEALEAAKEYISSCGLTEGWACNREDPMKALIEGIRRQNMMNNQIYALNDDEHNLHLLDEDMRSVYSGEDVSEGSHQSGFDDADLPDSASQAGAPPAKKKRFFRSKNCLSNIMLEPLRNTMPGVAGPSQSFKFQPGNTLKYTGAHPLNVVLFENLDDFLIDIWQGEKVRDYQVTARYHMQVSIPFAKLLNDNDTDLLFEHCMNFVKRHEPEARFLPAVDLVANVLFPEAVLSAIMKEKKVSYEEAEKFLISQTSNTGYLLDPEQNAGLNTLCSAAIGELYLPPTVEATTEGKSS